MMDRQEFDLATDRLVSRKIVRIVKPTHVTAGVQVPSLSKEDVQSFKKLEDYEWVCSQPFMNFMTNGINKEHIPCCVLKGWSSIVSKNNFQSYLKDSPNSKLMEFRQEFLRGGGPLSKKACAVCIEQEKHGEESHRRVYNDKFINEGGEYHAHKKTLEEYLETDFSVPYYLTMEYNAPSNFCNLRCHMCGPWNSSSIAKENLDIGHELRNEPKRQKQFEIANADSAAFPKGLGGHIPLGYKNEYHIELEDDFKRFDPILKNLVELKLCGGETLAIKHNYDLLEHIINLRDTSDCSLRITTNGTVVPKFNGKDIFHYIPYFKDCQINVSIEGWGEKNNYFRYPSKWEVIMKNTHKFAEMPKTRVAFASTINAINTGHLIDIAKEAVKLNKKYPETFVTPFLTGSLVWGSGEIYTLEAVPLDIREIWLDNIMIDSELPEEYNNEFAKIISLLENSKFDEKLSKKMLTDVKERDKHRGTCLLDLFPEWKLHYEKI